jgi:hypothetical protein
MSSYDTTRIIHRTLFAESAPAAPVAGAGPAAGAGAGPAAGSGAGPAAAGITAMPAAAGMDPHPQAVVHAAAFLGGAGAGAAPTSSGGGGGAALSALTSNQITDVLRKLAGNNMGHKPAVKELARLRIVCMCNAAAKKVAKVGKVNHATSCPYQIGLTRLRRGKD